MRFFTRLFAKSDRPLTNEELAKAGRHRTYPVYRSDPKHVEAWFIDPAQAEAEAERRNRGLKQGEPPWLVNSLDTLREAYARGHIGAREARALLVGAPDLTQEERARAAQASVWTLWYSDRIDRDSAAFAVNYFLDAATATAAWESAQASHEGDPWQSYDLTGPDDLLEQYEKGWMPLDQVRRLLNAGT